MFKNLFFLSLILTLIVGSCTPKVQPFVSATTETVYVKPLSKMAQKDSFPYSWFGNWVGNLEIYNSKGLSQTVPMEMVIGATDTAGVFQWNIIYGTDRVKGLRPYLLRTIDAKKGIYLNDEKNSIKMETYLFGSKLLCTYIVQGNFLTTIEEKEGDKLKFEIIFGKEKPVSVTGEGIMDGDTITPVKTMPVVINQRAVLTRKM